jgi:hypothetical protein
MRYENARSLPGCLEVAVRPVARLPGRARRGVPALFTGCAAGDSGAAVIIRVDD